eukprot:m.53476 g.53476  ORF g.53476 m.53476 type:complete len:177 (-) comp6767_c0_seq2:130-660(-)
MLAFAVVVLALASAATARPAEAPVNGTLGCGSWAMWKQCDSRWGSHELGTSSQTICQAGCAMSSVAMYLTTRGHTYNPDELNTWLKGHGGYVGGDELVWGAVNSLGISFQGQEHPSIDTIVSGLKSCHGIIANVLGGRHWVLLTAYEGDGVFSVNDPGFNTRTYHYNTMLRFSVYH